MSWDVSDQEFESVISLPPERRYSYFIKRAAGWEELWSLKNDAGWVLAGDPEENEAIPVWANARYAESCARGHWADCAPEPIALDEWLAKWIPGIKRDGRKIAVMQSPDNKGVVVEPNQLRDDILLECEKY